MICAVCLEYLVKLEILEFGNGGLSFEVLALVLFDKRNVLDDLHSGKRGKFLVAVLKESLFPGFNIVSLEEVSHNDIPLFLVELSLLLGEYALIPGVLEFPVGAGLKMATDSFESKHDVMSGMSININWNESKYLL